MFFADHQKAMVKFDLLREKLTTTLHYVIIKDSNFIIICFLSIASWILVNSQTTATLKTEFSYHISWYIIDQYQIQKFIAYEVAELRRDIS